MVPKCIICDTEVCGSIAIVRGDRMDATCKIPGFASVILAICVIVGCEVGRSDFTKGLSLRLSAACFREREREYAKR